MLYHELLERATTEDIGMFIAERNLRVREERRQDRLRQMKAKNRGPRGR